MIGDIGKITVAIMALIIFGLIVMDVFNQTDMDRMKNESVEISARLNGSKDDDM